MGITVAGWALTVGVVLALFALDLVLTTIRPHAVGYREAAAWSAFYIAVAVIFGCCRSGRPCGCTVTVTKTPISRTIPCFVRHAGYCLPAIPTPMAN